MFNHKYYYYLIFLVAILSSISSFGQAKPDSLQYNVDLNLSGRRISGTFAQVVIGGELNVDLEYKYWHFENKTTYRYNRTNEILIEDNWYDFASLKYYINGQKKLFPGIFYHYDNNLIFRVNDRHHFGFGLGSDLSQGFMRLALGVGVAQEIAEFNGVDFENSSFDFSNRNNGLFIFRINNGFSFLNNSVSLAYQLFYFQSFKEAADYDIWVTPKVSLNVIKNLSIYLVYDYRFENVHLESLSNYNDILVMGFNYKLEN